jgi:hypothetical protein
MSHTSLGASSDDHEHALSLQERLRHIGIFGITGVGKSTLLRNIAAQDMARGDGLLLLDPHGPLCEDVLSLVPRRRVDDVCYFNAGDREFPVGFNILADVHPDDHAVVAEGVVSAMRAIWLDVSWGPELERILRSSVIALIQAPRVSLVHLPRLLTDDAFRAHVVSRTRNPVVRQFFERQFDPRPEEERLRMIASVLNKIEAFLASDPLRNILGQDTSTLHLEHAMRHARIVIANLAKGAIGETPSQLMAGVLLARALAALMGRRRDKDLRPFHIIVDEAGAFRTGVLASLLREARKFFGSLTLATQDIASLDDQTRSAIMGSAKTLICFQLGLEDADYMAPYFNRQFQQCNPYALRHLEIGEAYWEDGYLYPYKDIEPRVDRELVIKQSRMHYGRSRELVERRIRRAMKIDTRPTPDR